MQNWPMLTGTPSGKTEPWLCAPRRPVAGLRSELHPGYPLGPRRTGLGRGGPFEQCARRAPPRIAGVGRRSHRGGVAGLFDGPPEDTVGA